MEMIKFLFMQVTALLFVVLQFFVLGAAFGAGAWVVWRVLCKRAGGVKSSGELPGGQPRPRPNPLS
jgi:hypothetical protein